MGIFSSKKSRQSDNAGKTTEQAAPSASENVGRSKVYNLVILDKSGSMNTISYAAVMGFNETLGGVRSAQLQYADTQTHYVSLLLFCGCERRYVYECVPVVDVCDFQVRDYNPCCSTPLYDAMGQGINDLLNRVKDDPDAAVIVTVITDGMENASTEYSGQAVKALVDKMRDDYGWSFSYIGANHDVETVAHSLSIDNTMTFSYDEEGMRKAWDRERKSREMRYSRMYSMSIEPSMSRVERKNRMRDIMGRNEYREWNAEYERRVTPDFVRDLSDGQVFVFGSNVQGMHTGLAAQMAVERFGAMPGQARGPQGRSYAIPVDGPMHDTAQEVNNFIQYAQKHPDQTFLVTMVGCGFAGHSVHEMARLFSEAVEVENIWLPKAFWNELI